MSDPWRGRLASLTPARVGLGRAGGSLPTGPMLEFALAHAKARDAVHAAFAADRLAAGLDALGVATVTVTSAAPTREVYLRRPDLGRLLAPAAATALAAAARGGCDVSLVVADGLSARAVETQAVLLIAALLPHLTKAGYRLAPVAIATQARVALADEIGVLLQARASVILIGERPGLSAPDSLGAYLTYAPRPGRTDAERNCISNIRAGGLGIEDAAFKIAWLLKEALRRGMSGIGLKDDSGALLLETRASPAIERR